MKTRLKDHWNRKMGPEIEPQKNSQLTIHKHAKTIQWRNDRLVNK